MKTLLLSLGILSALAFPAFADVTTLTSLDTPRGHRGDKITWSVRLKAGSSPLKGQPIKFSWRSAAHAPEALSKVTTNTNGVARIEFTIPTNPADDNVRLTAKFPGQTAIGIQYTPSEVTVRIEIGRR